MSRYASPTSKRYLWHLQQVRRRKRARREPDIDADAAAYIAAVEAEDGEALEPAIVAAYDQFVRGCKSDGIFDAIKASCIMAGARTLSGALVPLAGPAPTNFNFVSGDYDRVTGLKGDGATKRLDANFSESPSPPTNNRSIGVFITNAFFGDEGNYIGNGRVGSDRASSLGFRLPDQLNSRLQSGNTPFSINNLIGLLGSSRSSPDGYTLRKNGENNDVVIASEVSGDLEFNVFSRSNGSEPVASRLSFYSIGEALDLEALDTRVTALMTEIDEALS